MLVDDEMGCMEQGRILWFNKPNTTFEFIQAREQRRRRPARLPIDRGEYFLLRMVWHDEVDDD